MPDNNFYTWQPSFTAIKDPETKRYFGNVIADLSKTYHVAIINDEAEDQKESILDASQNWKDRIHAGSAKHVNLVAIIRAMTDGFREQFGIPEEDSGGVIVLGVSQLGVGILG